MIVDKYDWMLTCPNINQFAIKHLPDFKHCRCFIQPSSFAEIQGKVWRAAPHFCRTFGTLKGAFLMILTNIYRKFYNTISTLLKRY